MKVVDSSECTAEIDMKTLDDLENYLSRINALASVAVGSELVENVEAIDYYLAILHEYANKALEICQSIKFSQVT